MRQPVISQLIIAFCSFAGGLVFGVFYDALKAVRLRAKSVFCTVLCDTLVCFFGFFLLFYLAMAPGKGEVRVYIIACTLVGAVVYFCLMSPTFLGIFCALVSLVVKIMGIVRKPFDYLFKILIKLIEFLKKLFQKFVFRYKMRVNENKVIVEESSKLPNNGRADIHDVQTNRSNHKNRYSGNHRLRGDNLSVTESSGVGCPRAARRAANRGRRGTSKKH
ncbi:MAG: hypothetical protein CVU91_00110 [Firmicutes bacterium HGW-Firmicutes-16]|nr:MAG: hypothetical protein CVU91_00110 [Firmicutes bacterium HGW-Firmicutes-16]